MTRPAQPSLLVDPPNPDSNTGEQDRALLDQPRAHGTMLVVVTHDHELVRSCQQLVMAADEPWRMRQTPLQQEPGAVAESVATGSMGGEGVQLSWRQWEHKSTATGIRSLGKASMTWTDAGEEHVMSQWRLGSAAPGKDSTASCAGLPAKRWR